MNFIGHELVEAGDDDEQNMKIHLKYTIAYLFPGSNLAMLALIAFTRQFLATLDESVGHEKIEDGDDD